MCSETENVLRAQTVIAFEIRRRGYVMKVLAAKAQMHNNTFLSYFPADQNAKPTQLSMGAFNQLDKTGALDADLIGLLLNDNRLLIETPAGLDLDNLAEQCHDFLQAKTAAHHPDSPAGRDLSECERADLAGKVAKIGVGS